MEILKKHTPRVSIITPTYNRADYLEETIDSVLTQGYENLQYIVVDDGSTDHTQEVLRKYDGLLTTIYHPNMGETKSVNKGVNLSDGEYIMIVNSDDPLLENSISIAVNAMKSKPDKLVGYPDWIKIGSKGETIAEVSVPEYNYMYMLTHHHCIIGPGAIINRKALELTYFRDHNFKYVADFEYWLRLGLYGDFFKILTTLATFRVHESSISSSKRDLEIALEHIKLIKKYYSHHDIPKELNNFKIKKTAYGWAFHVASEFSSRNSIHWLLFKLMFHILVPIRNSNNKIKANASH